MHLESTQNSGLCSQTELSIRSVPDFEQRMGRKKPGMILFDKGTRYDLERSGFEQHSLKIFQSGEHTLS